MNLGRFTALGAFIIAISLSAGAYGQSTQPAKGAYADDPAVIELLARLKPGSSALLPTVAHVDAAGKPLSGSGRLSNPYARDYTNRMVYAPERQSALYQGGNHGAGRTNDVWEYHLGSNTWHRLFDPEGGDHATYKFTLMFLPRIVAKNPEYQMKDSEKANFEAAKKWWLENVVLVDGHLVTRGGGPLLVGHTWDTLIYEPNIRRTIQGTGAHCANTPWLHSQFTGMPIEQVNKLMERSLNQQPGVKSYKTMWLFDPAERKWIHYESDSPLAELRGMGATMCYIPCWKKTIFYVAAQNVTPNAFFMRTYDAINDRWEELKPNGGKSISELAVKLKVAPMSEQQTAYSPKHRKMVAVLGADTFIYDIDSNQWSKSEAVNDLIKAHDASTVFAYDSAGDIFLLCEPRTGKLAGFSLATGKWQSLAPAGDAMPKPPYCVGKGYYDPTHNVLVIQPAYVNRMWVYRHAPSAAN